MAERLPLAITPAVDGPRIRLGLAWFLVTAAAAATSPLLLALVLGAAAGLAADQVVVLQRGRSGPLLADPVGLPAVLAAAALPLAAAAGTDTLAAAAAAGAVVVLVHRLLVGGGAPGAVPDVALVLVAAVPIGMAAAAPVLLDRLGSSAALVLLVLVAAYEASDFLVGTGDVAPWEGPIAGVVAVAVCGFGAWVLAPRPLGGPGVIALVVGTAVLAPLGPPVASVLIGDGRRPARFVRRLDTLLVLGPVVAWATTVAARVS